MKRFDIKTAVLAAVIAVCACGCSADSTQSAASQEASSNESSAVQTSAPDTSDNTVSSDKTSSDEEYQYVSNGVFTLPNKKLAFTLKEGWELTSTSIAYQFANKNSQNRFNLVVSTAQSDIANVTSEQMTSTYETTMENFKLVTFEHTTINEKPAIYMQLSGKLSQMNTETVIYQYMIQSGTDAYCFSFTQSESDDSFAATMTDIMDSLIIA